MYCLAASRDGQYVASACVAKSAAAAEIWVWDIRVWKGVAQLKVWDIKVWDVCVGGVI